MRGGRRHGDKARTTTWPPDLPSILICEFQGAFLDPAILLNVDTKSSAYQEEIFGPVIIVNTFEDEADALAEANCVDFGLFCKAIRPSSCLFVEEQS